jgi:hypothetical protein
MANKYASCALRGSDTRISENENIDCWDFRGSSQRGTSFAMNRVDVVQKRRKPQLLILFIPAHHYPASSVLRASPPSHTARPGSRELPVDRDCDHRGGFPCRLSGPLCLHAVANTPAGLMELVRSYCPINFGLTSIRGGSAPALPVSGPAQRSPAVVTAYMLAKSPSRPSTPEAPTALLPPPPLRLLPGGANQFPVGTFTRGGPVRFHGARESWASL